MVGVIQFSECCLTEKGLNLLSKSDICTLSCRFILYQSRHLWKAELWAVIMGTSFWKILGNEALVCLKTLLALFHAAALQIFFSYSSSSEPQDPFYLTAVSLHWAPPVKAALFGVCPVPSVCAGSAAASQAARNCSHTRKVCLYSCYWVSKGKAKMKTVQSRLAFSFFPHFGSHGDPMFHASMASPPTSQSQAMLLGTDIFSSPTCVFCVPGGNFWAFHSGFLSCVLLEVLFC